MRMKDLTKDKERDPELTGQRRLRRSYSPPEIADAVAEAFSTSRECLLLRRSGFMPRTVAIYLSARYTPDRLVDRGRLFNIKSSAGGSAVVHRFSERVCGNDTLRRVIVELEDEFWKAYVLCYDLTPSP